MESKSRPDLPKICNKTEELIKQKTVALKYTYNENQETSLVVKLVLKFFTLPIIQKISDKNVMAEVSTFLT